jgi:hypothetical protein
MQIKREGRVTFGDASLSVWEEGIVEARRAGGHKAEISWERQFKEDVFSRIIQQLNRMGWKCEVPKEMIKQYSLSFARNNRYCRHGDIEAELSVSGRCIQLEMYQNIQNVKNSNGGKYDFGKEERMTYQQRLRMEYTRRKLRDYLCNVFSGYVFDKGRSHRHHVGVGYLTAMELVRERHAESYNKTTDFDTFQAPSHSNSYKSREGLSLVHGAKVWTTDRKGRIIPGTVYYNSGQMWWVVSGKYTYTNACCTDIWAEHPGELRAKHNSRERRSRLERLIAAAVGRMDFERAATLRDVLFPKDEALYMIWSDKHGGGYFGPNYSGYTPDSTLAGKYTRRELKPYLGDAMFKNHLRAVPVRAA